MCVGANGKHVHWPWQQPRAPLQNLQQQSNTQHNQPNLLWEALLDIGYLIAVVNINGWLAVV
jgi:hypothetical protein